MVSQVRQVGQGLQRDNRRGEELLRRDELPPNIDSTGAGQSPFWVGILVTPTSKEDGWRR